MLKYSKEFLIYVDRKLFKQTLEIENLLGEERALEYFNSNLNWYLLDECGYTNELYFYFRDNQEIVNNCSHQLIKYQDEKRKVEIIKYWGDYERTEIILKFPKGCSKQFKRKFLIKNNFPLNNRYYRINSPYDCTGQLHSEYVDFKKDKYRIVKCYDV